jgi:hypothetical protein
MEDKTMVRVAGLMVLVLMVAAPIAAGQTKTSLNASDEGRPAARGTRHSGRIVEVATDGSSILLDEMVAWTGPGTGMLTRRVRITPRTSIELVRYTGRWGNDHSSTPGWDSETIDAGRLRPGDFVTVTTDDNQRDMAVALQVVRPGA